MVWARHHVVSLLIARIGIDSGRHNEVAILKDMLFRV